MVVAAFQWKRKAADELSVLPASMIGSIIGFSRHWPAPAIGPKVYFAGQFPLMHATPAHLDRSPLYDFDPHQICATTCPQYFAWAVMTFLFTSRFPLVARAYAALFVLLTLCATIGLGEHYLIDLSVGMAVVLLVRGLTAARLSWRNSNASAFALIGFAMSLA